MSRLHQLCDKWKLTIIEQQDKFISVKWPTIVQNPVNTTKEITKFTKEAFTQGYRVIGICEFNNGFLVLFLERFIKDK